MEVSVIVPVFGQLHQRFAKERALPSIAAQTIRPREVLTPSAQRIHEARNIGAREASSEWLCFLDADDEIEPGYLAAMAEGSADLRGPATIFVRPTGERTEPALVPARPLRDSNYLVIGTLVRRAMFLDVGGFREWAVHEDYDLWLRCAEWGGASIEQIEGAVYVVHQRRGSRNLSYSVRERQAVSRRIQESVLDDRTRRIH